MKKFGFTLIVLTILGIVALAIMVAVHPPDDNVRGSVGPTGGITIGPGMVGNQTAITRDHVIDIARSDPVVQKVLDSCDNVSGPNYIPPGKTDVYLYDKERYAGVIFNATAGPRYVGPPEGLPISMTVIVDVYTMNEMGVLYRGMATFMYSWVIIPPGNGIYEMMGHWYTVSSPDYKELPEISSSIGSLNATPADAMLCPVIVDEDNLKRFLNGSAYEVPDVIDLDTGKTVRIDGTMPIYSGLKSTYVLPDELQPHTVHSHWNKWYFAIILNKETVRDVKVVFITEKPAIYDY